MSAACERFREELIDVAAGGAGSAELRAHLESCTACRSEVDELVAILAAPAGEAGPIPETRAPALVREDLAAVRDLGRRTPMVVAAAVGAGAVGLALLYVVHVRPDLSELPASFLYASIALLFAVGAIGVALGARLTALSARAAALFVGGSALFFVGYALILPSTSSGEVPASGADFFVRMIPCFFATSGIAVLPLLVTATLLRRARFYPPPASLAIGVGAGLLAMPAVELFCHISASSHVLLAHGAGIAFIAGLAWAAFSWIERLRLR